MVLQLKVLPSFALSKSQIALCTKVYTIVHVRCLCRQNLYATLNIQLNSQRCCSHQAPPSSWFTKVLLAQGNTHLCHGQSVAECATHRNGSAPLPLVPFSLHCWWKAPGILGNSFFMSSPQDLSALSYEYLLCTCGHLLKRQESETWGILLLLPGGPTRAPLVPGRQVWTLPLGLHMLCVGGQNPLLSICQETNAVN